MAIPARYSHIDFTPTAAMARAAARGLEYRKRGGGGGLTTQEAGKLGIRSGVARATSLKNRDQLSPETVRRMDAFFKRHAGNEQIGEGLQPWQDRGYVAFLLWGGRPGRAFAAARVKQMNAADRAADAD